MNSNLKFIETELMPLRIKLREHDLYKTLSSIEDIKFFMESHVFAVWDFMSLLKALQINLTSVSLPWLPKKNTNLVRFINEITLAEESDVNKDGVFKSHFEMYVDAMKEFRVDTSNIKTFLQSIQEGTTVKKSLELVSVSDAVKEFVNFTFDIINSKETHKIAAAFTYGREDIIPDMFLKIVEETSSKENITFDNFTYYLERHIELDGDEHGPLSLQMIEELCGDDNTKWQDVLDVAKRALQVRINLWTAVKQKLESKKEPILA
ncbi:DUF3050 domain-containing protein [Polaribacter sp. KT 15]|uniref:DUF3050 domain-containing protein n=1 Tax=Polaribacter sp. KT 15 TaxID=1896175 RepID=UPI00090A94C4|nr:DUF3050 domain-containing protein [Polaribacter sp. KT 15]SHM79216.1 Protein of unknown function [Polaribacter sp. KT 15]